MIDRIVSFSIRNTALVIAAVLVAALGGVWSMLTMPLDAVPNLADTQVIVYSRWDRSPDLVEDQVTYPIVSALTGAPGVRTVRGVSDFGYSFVYVVFEDGVDLYWARSRTLEYLSSVASSLPEGVKPELGPDATGLGWVFEYALVDASGKHGLDELRSYQTWHLRYQLKSVPGVAEVASVGGFDKQYQVNVDPILLRAYGIPIQRVAEAVRGGSSEVGGRVIEFGGTEYMVRGDGYARSVEDFEDIVVAGTESGSPIRVKNVGNVVIGPDLRRGIADFDGTGETVAGIVIMRQGQNALEVIDRVKAKLREIEPSLPEGVRIVTAYDRSDLIRRSVRTLKIAIVEVVLTISLVILMFLWHPPSAMIPIVTIPLAVLITFLPFGALGLTANIMSLGGIAIAIGAMSDASIVVVEQTHKKLEEWDRGGRRGDADDVVRRAIGQVAGPSFFSLLVIAVSFCPVLVLGAEEGRLFKPLAYTKILVILIAAILAITLDPALRMLLTRRATGRIQHEERHPVSRVLMTLYGPVLGWALRNKTIVLGVSLALVVATIPAFRRLGSEFMPPLDEGALLYMPTTMPSISITEAQRLLQTTDRVIKQFPEVDRVLGKAGRATTATDPAPLSMLETIVTLKPRSQWRRTATWYSSWAPEWMKRVFRHVTPDHISQESLVQQMDDALRLPGLSNAWTMPIKARTDMLSTGIRTPVGLKIQGADKSVVERIGTQVEAALRKVPGTRGVFAERTGGGYFLDVRWRRAELARYGLGIDEAQRAFQVAVGGENVTTTIEGRERYSVNVRYPPDFRSEPAAIARILITAGDGKRQIPVGELADIETVTGPSMIRDEDGLVTGYVYVDLAGRDPQGYVEEADPVLRAAVRPPTGYGLSWSGQYEGMRRVRQRLAIVVPATLLVVLLLLYLNTRSVAKTMIVLLAVPFSAVGAVWFLWILGYNMSVAVWIGLIALVGMDAETGVFMLLYLDLAYEHAVQEDRLRSRNDLRQAILEGAVMRLRPKIMTVAATFLGLLPIMWSTGAGSDVMKRIAAPMIGGIFTSFLLELVVYPGIFEVWKGHRLPPDETSDRQVGPISSSLHLAER